MDKCVISAEASEELRMQAKEERSSRASVEGNEEESEETRGCERVYVGERRRAGA